jgi:FkbM family methyltransferase
MVGLESIRSARDALRLDFFGGWNDADIELLSRFAGQRTGAPQPGEIFDWLGIRTLIRHHGWLEQPASGIIDVSEIPVPSDMIHAETIEYIGLLVSVERALAAGRKAFAMVELGASYGPWMTASGVMARRLGFEKVNLLAIEASERMISGIIQHAALNGLVADDRVQVRALHAAVYTHEQDLFFPKVDVSHDNGAQVSDRITSTDYRGLNMEYDRVRGITLRKVCEEFELVDFVHLDLQGAEELLLQDDDFLEVLTNKASTFFLATQSRFIEGLALRALSERGWVLIRERPTTFKFVPDRSDVSGWTLRDGGQLWVNKNFNSALIDF